MDLLKLIKSIEELLYEVVTWMFFYPRTLWRAIRHPLLLAAETQAQFIKAEGRQFADAVSPPLFLLLSILVAHGVEMALHVHLGNYKSELAKKIIESDTNLLIFRAVVFSLFPLLVAVGMIRSQGKTVDQNTLRQPFFVQCSFAAPFVVFSSMANFIVTVDIQAVRFFGVVLWAAAAIWYVAVETTWFRLQLSITTIRAFYIVSKRTVLALTISFAIAAAMFSADIVSDYRNAVTDESQGPLPAD